VRRLGGVVVGDRRAEDVQPRVDVGDAATLGREVVGDGDAREREADPSALDQHAATSVERRLAAGDRHPGHAVVASGGLKHALVVVPAIDDRCPRVLAENLFADEAERSVERVRPGRQDHPIASDGLGHRVAERAVGRHVGADTVPLVVVRCDGVVGPNAALIGADGAWTRLRPDRPALVGARTRVVARRA
jgi:hypothetical protein